MIYLLQYHQIAPHGNCSGSFVTPRIFENHIKELSKMEIKTLTRENYMHLLLHPPNENFVLITFDDGYENVYKYAFPILEKYGLKAAVFPITAYIGKVNLWEVPFLGRHAHLSRSQILELYKAGWIIGSHTVTHPDLRKLDEQKLKMELEISKKSLEDIIGDEIQALSYPYGLYNTKVKKAVRDAGYNIAFKSAGKLKFPLDFLEVPRRSVYISDFFIRTKLNPTYERYYLLFERVANYFARLSPAYLTIFSKSAM